MERMTGISHLTCANGHRWLLKFICCHFIFSELVHKFNTSGYPW